MPFKYQLTWVQQRKRWRKRYLGQTYFLKTKCKGKRDRAGYEEAVKEWRRLKDYVDGMGPSPYSPTGALIPEHKFPLIPAVPVFEEKTWLQPIGLAKPTDPVPPPKNPDTIEGSSNPFIAGTGLFYEQQVQPSELKTVSGERGVSLLLANTKSKCNRDVLMFEKDRWVV